MIKIVNTESHREMLPTLIIDEYIPLKIVWPGSKSVEERVHWKIENVKTLVDIAINRYSGFIDSITCPLLSLTAKDEYLQHFPQTLITSLGYPKVSLDNLENAHNIPHPLTDLKLDVGLVDRKIHFKFGRQPVTHLLKSGFVNFCVSEMDELCGFVIELTDSDYKTLTKFHDIGLTQANVHQL